MFVKQDRQGLVIYLYYNRDAKKLAKYGEVIYQSKKMRYLLLYVNSEKVEQLLTEISQLKYVKEVLPSYLNQIDQQFVGNLSH